eukprot:TRINITY_DN10568_c0_g1_i13.p1 TRINITY_DN10568_c0_g1~~TRINITY_DN10568_c0_g1_i13.p1  ORF type:complete len:356 (-),score=87.72 TRINITY_DN10568_c0_g1_i13:87-1154(-)
MVSCNEEEYEADYDYEVSGAIGIALFSLLCITATAKLVSLIRSRKSQVELTPQIIFCVCTIVFPLFELPRYIQLVDVQEYKCSSITWTYCLHLIASGFFFSSYTAIIYMYRGVFEADTSVPEELAHGGCRDFAIQMVSSKMAVNTVNVVFWAVVFFALGVCANSSTLYTFFETTEYKIYIWIDASKNLLYCSAILFASCSLIQELTAAAKALNEVSPGFDVHLPAIWKLTMLSIVTFICFITRAIMLTLKFVLLESGDTQIGDMTYPGPAWFLLADFIPRLVPSCVWALSLQAEEEEEDETISSGVLMDSVVGQVGKNSTTTLGEEESGNTSIAGAYIPEATEGPVNSYPNDLRV